MTNKRRFPAWMKWMLIMVVAVSTIIVSALIFLTASAISDNQFFNAPINPANAGDTRNAISELPIPIVVEYDEPPITRVVETAAEAAVIPTAEPIPTLDSDDRLTILLMGLDRRPGESTISRTDTMMILSIDPSSGDGVLMSVPRDLYVDIPGYSRERINTAFVLGAINGGGEAGGAKLAMATIERNLGVSVDHYMLVDFQAVINLIDAFGGVNVNVAEYIYDPLYPDMNYGYDPLEIYAGEQVMSGELALKYMRTRHGDNDFERSRRQQNLILALRRQVLSQGITGLTRRIPTIYNEIKGGIFTDLSVNDMVDLLGSAASINADNIQSAVIDYNYAYSYTTATGASVLILRTEPVTELVASLFD